jgi:ankyrin repeat protein
MKQLDARKALTQETAKRISQDILPSEDYSKQRNFDGALYSAAMNGDTIAIKGLLDKGADVNARFSGLYITALHAAAIQNEHNACALLLEKGANPFALNDLGKTPLQQALSWRSSDLVVRTLAEGMARAIMGKENGKAFIRYLRACLSS